LPLKDGPPRLGQHQSSLPGGEPRDESLRMGAA
jgi:hypothetical protein